MHSDKAERIISIMEKEAKKRNAPVFKVKHTVKKDPFRVLIYVILSARTKDEASIKAGENLFSAVRNAEALAKMKKPEVEQLIRPVGFYRQKAKNITASARMVVSKYGGKVPCERSGLMELPGVGRKSANIVLSTVFKKDVIPVDTHVHRLSNRLGFVKTKRPQETEAALMKVFPRKYWRRLNKAMVGYGQTVCVPVSPYCSICRLKRICPKKGVEKSR